MVCIVCLVVDLFNGQVHGPLPTLDLIAEQMVYLCRAIAISVIVTSFGLRKRIMSVQGRRGFVCVYYSKRLQAGRLHVDDCDVDNAIPLRTTDQRQI